MTKAKTEPDQILTNFLRANLTDINSSRSGQWIYPDFPMVANLGDNQFPRVGITILSETSESLGIFDDTQYETITFQIDVVTKKDLTFNHTITDEALGTITSTVNSNRLVLDFPPATVTNVKHDGSSYSTVTLVDTDADFTTPASLGAGTVEVSKSTGNLNFSASDVTSHNGEAITSTYVVKLSEKLCCQYVARNVVETIRNNWRTSDTINGLLYPVKIGNQPIPLDEELGIYRQQVEYQFRMFNAGEGI